MYATTYNQTLCMPHFVGATPCGRPNIRTNNTNYIDIKSAPEKRGLYPKFFGKRKRRDANDEFYL